MTLEKIFDCKCYVRDIKKQSFCSAATNFKDISNVFAKSLAAKISFSDWIHIDCFLVYISSGSR